MYHRKVFLTVKWRTFFSNKGIKEMIFYILPLETEFELTLPEDCVAASCVLCWYVFRLNIEIVAQFTCTVCCEVFFMTGY